ncbi:TetR/AcrR family transcriptional regulator [Clostridium sp. BJN0001]|uniref:TetR/AcrR family transcriptional regulator n=1 Tax=Clostridium sp. BJN0001 TaxID=2930219 RepID=UPI001FD54E29|nr:TetR/AcrR family transcriptional regulator [Clostridium sp. BJN0001]
MNKTKELIFKSAIKVFSNQGYKGATMDDIALNAGLAKGTLYYHFKSKEEIFQFVIREGLNDLRKLAEKIKNSNTDYVSKLIEICKGQLTFLYTFTDLCKVVMSQIWGNEQRQENLRKEVRGYIYVLKDLLEEGRLLKKIQVQNVELMAYQIFGTFASAAIYESLNVEKMNSDDITTQTVVFALKGLGINIDKSEI